MKQDKQIITRYSMHSDALAINNSKIPFSKIRNITIILEDSNGLLYTGGDDLGECIITMTDGNTEYSFGMGDSKKLFLNGIFCATLYDKFVDTDKIIFKYSYSSKPVRDFDPAWLRDLLERYRLGVRVYYLLMLLALALTGGAILLFIPHIFTQLYSALLFFAGTGVVFVALRELFSLKPKRSISLKSAQILADLSSITGLQSILKDSAALHNTLEIYDLDSSNTRKAIMRALLNLENS